MSDSFYVIIPSNTPSYCSHINKNTDFKVKLESPVILNGKYDVGLAQINLPPAEIDIQFKLVYISKMTMIDTNENLFNSIYPIIIKENFESQKNALLSLVFLENQKQSVFDSNNVNQNIVKNDFKLLKYLQQNDEYLIQKHIFIPTNAFDVPKKLKGVFDFKEHNSMLLSDDIINFIKDFTEVSESSDQKSLNVIFKPLERYYSKDITGNLSIESFISFMPNFNHYATSRFMKYFGYTDHNHPFMDLPNIGLKYQLEYSKISDLQPEKLNVIANIVDYTKVGDEEQRLLKLVRRKTPHEHENIEYKHIQYISVNTNDISELHIQLLSSNEDEPAHLFDKSQLVVHFKKS